jgi:alkanesulfonate monooxygenase SsuD/methylene tetrahydromethanopterin reductase-like flavin-dependent oxidoreductase (luciferase family)
LAAATRNIGLGATRSTTYDQPYHIAREFQTLDHLSGGRAAWNVVTSMNDGEALNFGLESHLNHDQRYDRADEFMELIHKLWDSWERDALILDRVAGVYADADKVHYVNHVGTYFKSRGPLNIPPGPQGRPVIIQAGASDRGVHSRSNGQRSFSIFRRPGTTCSARRSVCGKRMPGSAVPTARANP